MPATDDIPAARPNDACAQLRHDLLTPVTVIVARAALLSRAIERSPTLTAEERARMLASAAAINDAAHMLGMTVAGIDSRRSSADAAPRRRAR